MDLVEEKVPELRNETGLTFEPLIDEWREYDYVVGDEVVTLRVNKPRFINIHPVHGAHRILDADGVAHYMPGHWLPRVGLRWKVPEDAAHFSLTVAPTSKVEG